MRFRTEFRNIFETTLDQGSLVYSAADKLNALYRFCTGDARQAIEDCRMGELNEAAYKTAWDILYDNFGRPLYIVGAFIDELTSKDPVDTNDLQSLMKVSDRLQSASRVLTQCNALSQVNAPKVLYTIYERFPKSFLKEFSNCYRSSLIRGEEPTFVQFVDFVKREATVAKSPLVKFINSLQSTSILLPEGIVA